MSRLKLTAVVGVVGLLLVWTVRTFVVDETSTQSARATPAVVSDTPAAVVVDAIPAAAGEFRGIPVGYPASEAGAATAAVNWVASFPRLMRLNPLSLRNTLLELLSNAGAATGADQVVDDYFALFEELGPEFRERVWIESPLQTAVLESTATSATIGVWSVVVSGDVGDARPVEALWRTQRIGVVWERGDWKIDSIETTEGPTPVTVDMALPADPNEFTVVGSWTPAVFADTTSSAD